jgi:hypothetical protein
MMAVMIIAGAVIGAAAIAVGVIEVRFRAAEREFGKWGKS